MHFFWSDLTHFWVDSKLFVHQIWTIPFYWSNQDSNFGGIIQLVGRKTWPCTLQLHKTLWWMKLQLRRLRQLHTGLLIRLQRIFEQVVQLKSLQPWLLTHSVRKFKQPSQIIVHFLWLSRNVLWIGDQLRDNLWTQIKESRCSKITHCYRICQERL